jgi:MFS transporter, DHA1 family, inner membrane transport protein
VTFPATALQLPAHRRGRSGPTLLVLALCTFIFITAETMPIGLLTLMAPSLRVSPAAIGGLVTGYGVVVAVTSVPLTRWTLRFPRRPLLLGAFALFTLSVLATAAAPDFAVVLVARVLTALAHAVFWSIIATTAASLYPPERRGRAVATLFAGTSLAAIVGVPMVTWLGLHEGWRATFVIGGVVAAVVLAALAVLLPHSRRSEEASAVGTRPDRRSYRVLLATTALGVGAVFTFQTYITLYLTKAAGFATSSLGPTLFLGGLGGLLGVAAAGRFVQRRPYAALLVPLLLATLTLFGLAFLVSDKPAVVALVVLRGVALSGWATAMQVQVMTVAPGSTDVASAGSSSMFNVGIAGGALLGGLVVSGTGVRWVALAGGLVSVVAVVVLLGSAQGRRRAEGTVRQPAAV